VKTKLDTPNTGVCRLKTISARKKEKVQHYAKEDSHKYVQFATSMGKADLKKIPDKLTDSERKQQKSVNKGKANPTLRDAKKEKNDACRDRRAAAGSSKSFS